MAKAEAYLEGRNYVTPEDIAEVFTDVCRHRLILHPKAHLSEATAETILQEILEHNKAPKLDK